MEEPGSSDNVKIYRYTKFDQNIPCGSSYEHLAITCWTYPWQSLVTFLHFFLSMLKCISMQNLIKIYGAVQEL